MEVLVNIGYKTFNTLAITLGVLAVALMPFWPYSGWGYMPSVFAIGLIMLMFSLRALGQD
jgi:hypothetical protein